MEAAAAVAAAAEAGRHCMVGEELEVGSPLPHKEVVNSLAKTLKWGGMEEKITVLTIVLGLQISQ